MKADDKAMTALHTIEAWAEEDPKNHVFFGVLHDKSDKETDTFISVASGNQKDIASALAYTAWKSPDFEGILKTVAATLPKYKEFMEEHTKKKEKPET